MTRSESERDDRLLVTFLKQHQPVPPPPAVDLEARLFAQIAGDRPCRKQRTLPYFGMALVVALLGVSGMWVLGRQPRAALSAAERQDIETALMQSWTIAIDRDIDATVNPIASADIVSTNNGSEASVWDTTAFYADPASPPTTDP